ncbi:MAG: polymorphic toxin type 37 domain-containing protein [Candidatus Babeliales bacterium]
MSVHKYILFFICLFGSQLNAGFIAGTIIKTTQGYIPIEMIVEGDQVCSYNTEKNVFEFYAVTHINQKKVTHLKSIAVDQAIIITDTEQQFYLCNEEKWINALDLQPGMQLQSYLNKKLCISEVKDFFINAIIYELTVECNHNFCVTTHELVAHNFVIAIPILVFGSGKIALATGAFKAFVLGAGTALGYIAISKMIGASLDENMDLSHVNFESSDPFAQKGGIYEVEKQTHGPRAGQGCITGVHDTSTSFPKKPCVQPLSGTTELTCGTGNEKSLIYGDYVGKQSSEILPQDAVFEKRCIISDPKLLSELEQKENGFAELDLNAVKEQAALYKKNSQPKAPDPNGAQAPGLPEEKHGFEPPKNWDGKKVRHPDNGRIGWPDKYGYIWVPSGPFGHGGAHWDVQDPDGRSYDNVYPSGHIRPGRK